MLYTKILDIWAGDGQSHATMVEDEQPNLTERELKKLCRFMLPGDGMRHVAQDLSAHDYAALNDPEFYLRVLDERVGPGFNRRLIAAEALRFTDLTSDQADRVEPALRAIASYNYEYRFEDFFLRSGNVVWKYIVGYTLLFAWLYVAMWLYSRYDTQLHSEVEPWPFGLAYLFAFVFFFVIPAYSLWKDSSRYRRLRKVCAIALGRWGGPASVETLIRLSGDGELWNSARSSLRKILKRLTPEDYGVVSTYGIDLLGQSLSETIYSEELDRWVPLLLNTFEMVGTGVCYPYVKNLAFKGNKSEWREHATRILPLLRDRQRMEQDSSRLLRAASHNTQKDVLLRPVSSQGKQCEDTLLQAVNDD